MHALYPATQVSLDVEPAARRHSFCTGRHDTQILAARLSADSSYTCGASGAGPRARCQTPVRESDQRRGAISTHPSPKDSSQPASPPGICRRPMPTQISPAMPCSAALLLLSQILVCSLTPQLSRPPPACLLLLLVSSNSSSRQQLWCLSWSVERQSRWAAECTPYQGC